MCVMAVAGVALSSSIRDPRVVTPSRWSGRTHKGDAPSAFWAGGMRATACVPAGQAANGHGEEATVPDATTTLSHVAFHLNWTSPDVALPPPSMIGTVV